LPDLTSLTRIVGLGPRKAEFLFRELGVRSPAELSLALAAGKVRGLKGFGAAAEARLRAAVADVAGGERRFSLADAEQQAAPIVEHLRDAPGAERVEVAGGWRRRCDTVAEVDVLVVSARPAPVLRYFAAWPGARDVDASELARASLVLESGLRVNVRVVPRRCYGAALHYLTGSSEHTGAVRQLGLDVGVRISEYGVFRLDQGRAGARRIGGQQEEDVFSAVGLDWVPPELRECRGEIEAALRHDLPRLITTRDIRGDLRLRTAWSTGTSRASRRWSTPARPWATSTAPSPTPPAAARAPGAWAATEIQEQAAEVDRLRSRLHGFHLLRGMTWASGRTAPSKPTTPNSPASTWSSSPCTATRGLSRIRMTDRIIRAMEHPTADILAHPTGRLPGPARTLDMDMDAVLSAAAALGVAVEANAQPDRLDLNDVHIRRARELGAVVVINSDARVRRRAGRIRYGVDQARRGWIEPDTVRQHPAGCRPPRLAPAEDAAARRRNARLTSRAVLPGGMPGRDGKGPPPTMSGTALLARPRPATRQPTRVTLVAFGPLASSIRSNSTRSPSDSDLKPLPWMAEWWTKQSFEPFSGVMKPKPFVSLNHFTVPVVRIPYSLVLWMTSSAVFPYRSILLFSTGYLPAARADAKKAELALRPVPPGRHCTACNSNVRARLTQGRRRVPTGVRTRNWHGT
jgi:DNA polymerase (family X)